MSLAELVRHPRWTRETREILRAIESRDLARLSSQVGPWYAVSHPLSLSLSLIGLAALERHVFLDIETLGMMTEPVILVGLAWPEGDESLVRQLVVRGILEELPVLGGDRQGIGTGPDPRHLQRASFRPQLSSKPFLLLRPVGLSREAQLRPPVLLPPQMAGRASQLPPGP